MTTIEERVGVSCFGGGRAPNDAPFGKKPARIGKIWSPFGWKTLPETACLPAFNPKHGENALERTRNTRAAPRGCAKGRIAVLYATPALLSSAMNEPDLTKLLADLIAIPSVNPMGETRTGAEFLEGRMTVFIERFFEHHDLPWERQTVHPGRENILARLEGRGAAANELILWDAHQDTVPVEGMTVEPWKPLVRDGRMYGRGACDIKGGMTAMLDALLRLKQSPPESMPTIVMACTVNEEFGCTGAAAVTTLWEASKSSILPRRPDAVIVAEPTEMQVIVAHKGPLRWRLTTRGRAVHSSAPEKGENAIYKMARAIAALEEYASVLPKSQPAHLLCGPATLSVGTIQGGISPNTVPDRAVITIDRRLLPGENAQEALADARRFLEQRLKGSEELELEEVVIGLALSDDLNRNLAERLGRASRAAGGEGKAVAAPYGTNAASYASAGAPSVVFGPGSITQAHTIDEWIDLRELAKARDALVNFATGPQ